MCSTATTATISIRGQSWYCLNLSVNKKISEEPGLISSGFFMHKILTMENKARVVEIDGERVVVFEGEEGYTLCLANRKGGPIIFNENYDVAVEKFKKAMNVCLAVKSLVTVSRMLNEGASDEEIREELRKELK